MIMQREDVWRALNALPERERQVIEMRYGLTGERPYTLEEVGQAFGVTRERIRQIENNTLRKLQRLPEAQRLREPPVARRAPPPLKLRPTPGGVPEWSKGAVCKTAGSAYAGSSPASPIALRETRMSRRTPRTQSSGMRGLAAGEVSSTVGPMGWVRQPRALGS